MLEMNLEFIRGMLFIRLKGKLDQNTYTKLNDCLDQMIHEKKLKYFIINLENLEKIDEKGIKTILDRYYDISVQDGRLVLCGVSRFSISNQSLRSLFFQIEKTNNELSAFHLINI